MSGTNRLGKNQHGIPLTNDEIIKIAIDSGSRREMRKLHNGAYQVAIKRRILDSVYPPKRAKFSEYFFDGKNKKCPKCKEIQPISQFHTELNSKDGLSAWCKNCKKTYRKTYKQRPEIRARDKHYEFVRGLKRYNISPKTYSDLLQKQHDKCAICKRHRKDLKRNLSVDHCHKTGKIRGLLCDYCNPGLGYFMDSTELLMKAITYLKDNG